jgi:hypothetical protein
MRRRMQRATNHTLGGTSRSAFSGRARQEWEASLRGGCPPNEAVIILGSIQDT